MKCSECGSGDLDPIGETHSLNLYAHTDERYQCRECGEIRVYGKGENERESFSFYLIDSTRSLVARPPECPDHELRMAPTKLRPESGEHGTVQFKCPECELIGSRELRELSE